MMANSGFSTLLKLGAFAGAGYLAYEWWIGQQAPAAAAPPAAAPGGSTPASSAPAAAAPSYSGPSLDQIYASLVKAAITGMQGGDTSVTCPGLSGFGRFRGLGIGTGSRGTITSTDPMVSTPHIAVAGGVAPRSSMVAPAAPVSCATPSASPWVWNYYLQQTGLVSAVPDITVAFPGVDDSAPMSASTYWAGVSPLVSKSLGMSGLGAFGRMFRRGFGDDGTGDLAALPSVTYAGASGGIGPAAVPLFDLPAGSSYGSTPTGQLSLFATTPTYSAPGAPVSSISPGMIALGIGAVVLVVGMGGRRH